MAETDPIETILVQTRHAGNIGAVARLLKNLDLHSLTLVDPTPRAHIEAIKMAVGAEEIIENARIVPTLEEAIESCAVTYAITRRKRKIRKNAYKLAEATPLILQAEGRVGLLFGSERYGLSNEQIALCGSIVTIPVSTAHGSYNLAQAAAIVLYPLRAHLLRTAKKSKKAVRLPAPSAEKRILYDRMVTTIRNAGFFGAANDAKVIASIEDIFERATLDQKDVRILLGVFKQLQRGLDGAIPRSEGREK